MAHQRFTTQTSWVGTCEKTTSLQTLDTPVAV